MKKKISVIVPVYNAKKYVEKCIESILNQTYENIDVVIIDDGSTDGSGEICDDYCSRDDRIRVIHIANGGSVLARKKGLEVATGEYISFVDADDYISENMIADLASLAELHRVDFVATNHYFVQGDKIQLVSLIPDELVNISNTNERKEAISRYYLKEQPMIPYGLWLKLYKNEFIKKCFDKVPNNQQYGEDSLILFWMLVLANSFYLSSQAYYYYRVREESLSHFDSRLVFKREYELAQCREAIFRENTEIINEADFWDFTGRKLKLAYESRFRQEGVLGRYKYYFNGINALNEKKIILYGAGVAGSDYYEQLVNANVEIVAVVDQRGNEAKFAYAQQVLKPDEIEDMEYDYIIISIVDTTTASNVKQYLVSQGIPERKILWEKPEI